ncbi:MAG: lytic transglycosylase domain-containing protein [Pseudobdellovibrio sp.]
MKSINKIIIIVLCLIQSKSFGHISKWASSLPATSYFIASIDIADRVEFWRKIYSEYTTKQGVFHLVENPNFILGEVDLTSIYNNAVLNDKQKNKEIKLAIEKKRTETAKKWKISNIKKIRLQMGLKDRMQNALYISGRYLPMMEKIFKKNGLPVELTRIVFVESSFNIFAQSKVGASGLWQIMPSVARPLGYMTMNYDKRNHPIYATELAARILKQNFKKLGSWPLAITAYNHGLSGVMRMKSKSKSSQIEDLIDSERKTKSWGFASRNFYACFLAVLEVERNATDLFGENLIQSKESNSKEIRLTQTTSKVMILKWFSGSISRFRTMNPHLNWSRIMKSKKVPAGVPLLVPSENYQLALNQTT